MTCDSQRRQGKKPRREESRTQATKEPGDEDANSK